MEMNENLSMTNLQKFLDMYENTVRENNTIIMDIDVVLRDISQNIFHPRSDNEKLKKLYEKGINLNKDIALQKTVLLKKLKDDKLYELIVNIERTHSQLNKEYQIQVKKGVEAGVYKILNR